MRVKPTSNPIDHFELRCKKRAADSYSPNRFELFSATHAGLALALDFADVKRIELLGRFGPGSSAIIYAVRNQEFMGAERFLKAAAVAVGAADLFNDDSYAYLSEERADEMLVIDGKLDRDVIEILRTTVWNGREYVDFYPSRSLALWRLDDDE